MGKLGGEAHGRAIIRHITRYKSVKKSNVLYNILAGAALIAAAPQPCHAFPLTTYTTASQLAEGRWVKVAVTSTGMHMLPVATLREWGFTDPSKVRVYGYGGARIPDHLTLENYIDDLPAVQTVTLKNGSIAFYATGPVSLSEPDSDGLLDHRQNPWSTVGYYFITESDEPAAAIPTEGTAGGSRPSTTVRAYAFHELDRTSPGESGHLLVGEDFRYNNRNTFTLDMPGRAEGTPVDIRTRFFTFISSGSPTLTISANNSQLGTPTRLPITTSSTWGDTCRVVSKGVSVSGTRLNVGLSLSSTGVTRMANLDNLGVSYTRQLTLSGNQALTFGSDNQTLSLAGAGDATVVWDVTNPLAVKRMKTTSGTTATWTSPYTGYRRYAAFNENSTLPVPEFAGRVENQNIHAEPVPDMVIVSSGAMLQQAERIADFHRQSADSLRVLVVNKEKVWNEFGSGVADINAVRKMLKMFYDRGTSDDGHRLKYALMMGRPSHDHRHLTEVMSAAGAYDNMPIWQTDAGNSDSNSYSTDDFLAMLEDNSGKTINSDILSIAVGRIAVRDAAAAKTYVDKFLNYHSRMPEGDWKNKIVILADDQDNGVHLSQAETLVGQMQVAPDGLDHMYNKVYIDAYEKVNGVTEGARTQMYKWLNEGAMWWMYIGHASIDTWTKEGMLTHSDINDNLYFRRLPILYAATCTFSSWDGTDDSGAELMVMNPNGGVIASICPVRPVYISSNGIFSRNMGATFLERDETGRFLPIGEIVRRAKNRNGADSNKLRYVINGDPAMRVPTPANKIVLESINGVELDNPDEQPTVMAHQRPVMTGYVTDWEGNVLTDFNGTLYLTIYDAEQSIVTLGRGDEKDPGKVDVFEQQGSKLYTGRDKIVNGRFSITVAMPSEIAWNYRNAAANMYAVSDDSSLEAMGCNRNFYVYGYDDTVEADDEGPKIDALYLNHETFANGDVVNESPMMFAQVSDNIGINLSTAGVGHTLLMRIDDTEGFTDVSEYYIPASDGTPSGTVTYPVENLAAGNHTLTFRVWDTSNNFAQSTIDFYVQPGLAPKIFDVYTDTNPAYTEANFYVRHNRPDATLTVKIAVYDLQGREQWSDTATGRSDMFVSTPITWNLTDRSGRRVPRGIYVYRATVTTDGEQETSESRRIAVAAL